MIRSAAQAWRHRARALHGSAGRCDGERIGKKHVGLELLQSRRFFGAMFLASSGRRTKAVARRCICRVCSIAVWPMNACPSRSRRVHEEATMRHCSDDVVFDLRFQKRRSAVSNEDQHANPDHDSSRSERHLNMCRYGIFASLSVWTSKPRAKRFTWPYSLPES